MASSTSSSTTSYATNSSGFSDSGYSECCCSCSSCDSDMPSTPHKCSTHCYACRYLKVVNPALRKDLEGRFCEESIPVERFVQAVYGLCADDVGRIMNHNIVLPAEPLKRYTKSAATKNGHEPSMYAPFQQMFEHCLRSICDLLNVDLEQLLKFFEASGYCVLDGVGGSKRKPDGMVGHADAFSDIQRLAWRLIFHYFEFKKPYAHAGGSHGSHKSKQALPSVVEEAEGRATTSKHTLPEPAPKRATAPRTSSTRSLRQTTEAQRSTQLKAPTRQTRSSGSRTAGNGSKAVASGQSGNNKGTSKVTRTSSGGAKRGAPNDHYTGSHNRSSDTGSQDTTMSHSKRRRIEDAIAQELQAAQYALECMDADTSRYYVTNVCVDGFEIWLMYHNRDRVYRSALFDFRKSPRLLALIAFAMTRCTPVQAGFDPHLQFPVADKDGAITYTNDVAYPRNLDGARFVLPKSKDQSEVTFVVEGSSPIYSYMGLIGRGTMVYPVRKLVDNVIDDTRMALKTCWTSPGRTPEPVFLERLKKKLPHMAEHFPVVEAWREFEQGQPFLEILDEEIRKKILEDSRRLIYQVTLRLQPLWELDSVEEFESCYIDIVEMHFHAHDDAQVLHRDISENNAMSRRRASDGKALGYLNDWDLACFVGSLGLSEPSTSQHRTGTGPFMAIDLQRPDANGKTPVRDHRYCHDLESLFWLLVWAVLHFDLKTKRRRECLLLDWEGDWQDAAKFKSDFLYSADAQQMVLDMALKPYKDLVKRWICPLADMFDSARQNCNSRDAERRKIFDHDMYAKEITFEKFMATIEVKPREWAPEKK
ncbi:hypothetical protein BD626DRAFT_583670 [Schizophyllum amplum]|uniref:Fungal-type protein kinase domain-containing protein n=1 Tax=Schizophyllum amplum TaxID=97359 RepID=A0A550CEM5_9AGAR|nr:hypothetical protein BD626DRAFT_630381 [Auriculariopsis ampla]TRM63266.1 hypothetical protein BD626DRAFT_583670 [Auriculariopsis ampla]